jgi:hypothetical protein
MSGIPFGAIVLTDFPFTDLTSVKRRPALAIYADNDRRADIVSSADRPIRAISGWRDANGFPLAP